MTPSSVKRLKIQGFTLAEVVVSLALVSLLLVSLAQLLWSCTRYLNQTTLTTELQQSCVVATSRLVTELLESNGNSIRGDDVNQRYCSFGSARNDKGEVTFDTAGELQWHSIVGYYVLKQGEESALYRKERSLGSPAPNPPAIPSNYDEVFWNNEPTPQRLVASRVYYLDVVSSTTVDVILGVKSRDEQFVVNIKTKLKARN